MTDDEWWIEQQHIFNQTTYRNQPRQRKERSTVANRFTPTQLRIASDSYYKQPPEKQTQWARARKPKEYNT